MTQRMSVAALLAVLLVPPGWCAEEPLTPAEREKLHKQAEDLHKQAALAYRSGKPAEAVRFEQQNLAIRERLYPVADYPDGHDDLASCLNNVGFLLQATGEYGKASPYYHKALAMFERLYPLARFKDGCPELAASLNNLGFLLAAMGEYGKALPYYEKALAMNERLYPPDRFKDGHPDLAASFNNLGSLMQRMGENGKALPYYEKALAMKERLYPPERFKNGHPQLALGCNNLGVLLKEMGEYGKALPYYEKALAMNERLYPPERYKNGHPDLVANLGNLGALLSAMREHGRALRSSEKALGMSERLYPPELYKEGHPVLAFSLNNLGGLLKEMGEPGKALPYWEKAMAMRERLHPLERYPDGHPDLARSLSNLGFLLRELGEHGKALPYLQQAARSYTRQAQRETAAAPETQALALLRSLPPAHLTYLSSARQVPESPADDAHALLWPTKGFVLDLLTRRHQAARADAAPDSQARWQQLIDVRRRQNRLASEPIRDPVARQQRLTELADRQDQLERELAATLPELPRRQQLAALGPKDLLAKLPPAAVFVDVYHHGDVEKGKFIGYRYQAFVLVPGQKTKRVDLGLAQPIDEAIMSWRQSIERREASRAPARLKELVWDKLAAALSTGTKLVYLCPDGDLARLPWAALPGSKPDTILLEEMLVAVVPAGKWLLEQLCYPQPTDPDATLLAAGDIDYGVPPKDQKTGYPLLTETNRELKRVLEAFGTVDGLQGTAATPAALKERLLKARYAHFATHGYFDAEGVTAEEKRLREQLKNWSFDSERQSQGVGVRQHPLGYVGLVLAGGNDPKNDGILTGLGLVDLPLEKLRLCVLSACETGLGELTAGEGVVGLQRAFHVAGCPNVIGSLWKVNDAATAALMTKFYYELRVGKRPPLEALREAQLTIYRRPDLIPDLAGERGAPNFKKAIEVKAVDPLPKEVTGKKTADTKLWAAFVLSGVGK